MQKANRIGNSAYRALLHMLEIHFESTVFGALVALSVMPTLCVRR